MLVSLTILSNLSIPEEKGGEGMDKKYKKWLERKSKKTSQKKERKKEEKKKEKKKRGR